MVNEVIETTPITDEEIEAAKRAIVEETLHNPQALEDFRTKNSVPLTVMMPPMLRELVREASGSVNADGSKGEGSDADWARQLIATALNYEFPLKQEKTKKSVNKRDVELKQKANRAAISDLIERSRRGEISLS